MNDPLLSLGNADSSSCVGFELSNEYSKQALVLMELGRPDGNYVVGDAMTEHFSGLNDIVTSKGTSKAVKEVQKHSFTNP